MTKRIIAVIMVLTLCIGLCACGGETAKKGSKQGQKISHFDLRSGILFGDSAETIKMKEKELTYSGTYDNNSYLGYKGKIAGYNGNAKFYINNNKLYELLYNFETSSSSTADDIYSTIFDSCTRQYGKHTHDSSTGNVNQIMGKAYDDYASYLLLEAYGYKEYVSDLKYNEWVLVGDYEENVVIDLAYYYYRDNNGETTYIVIVSYHYFSNEELVDKYIEQVETDTKADSAF